MRVEQIQHDSSLVEPLKPREMRVRWDEACRRPALDAVLALERVGPEWSADTRLAYYRALAINLAIQVDSLRAKTGAFGLDARRPGASLAGKLVDDAATLELLLLSTEMMELAVEPATGQTQDALESSDWRQASRTRTRAGKLMHFLGMLTDGVMDSIKLGASAPPGQIARHG